MAFSIPIQPRTICPNPKSGPIVVGVYTDEHIVNYGTQKAISLTFTSATVADTTTLVIAGVTLTVDSATFFTKNTFAWNTTALNAATAFARMIRANFSFNNVWVVQQDETVILFWQDYGSKPSDDLSAVAGDLTVNYTIAGADIETKEVTLWYKLYKAGNPVSEVRSAAVPYDPLFPWAAVKFQLEESFALLLSTQFPGLGSMTAPEWQQTMLDEFTFRAGTVEKVNCENVYGTALETFTFKVVNSVFQHYDTNDFLDHCYARGSLAKFLTDRPDCWPLCFDSYEWLFIYLELPAGVGDADPENEAFKVLWEFYDAAGGLITTNQALISFATGTTSAVYAIPTGTSHDPVDSFLPFNADTMQVKVQFKSDIDSVITWHDYSETYTYKLRECDCHEEEVYFLNWKGGFDTINFRKVTKFDVEVDALILTSKHFIETFESIDEYYNKGARQATIDRADERLTLISDRIANSCFNLCWIEQFLTSPEHYIRYQDANGRDRARRVVLDYNTTTILQVGQVFRLQPSFVYLDELETH